MTHPTRLHRSRRGLLAALAAFGLGVALPSPAAAQTATSAPVAAPVAQGLSAEGSTRISEWLRAEVAAKKIPGAVLMIWRGGKPVYAQAVGQRDPALPAPMSMDDIFRIYSMSKPIVSVAAMMLVEEGRIDLDAPVAKYIPAFAQLKVGVEKSGPLGQKTLELVDAQRTMSVRDLMRHTSGLTYGFFGSGLVKQAYRVSNLELGRDTDNAEFAERIARLPLAYEPGTTWDYSVSTDILGRIVEVASGQPLAAFLKARLFDPLGMKDTSFTVPEPDRQARIAEPLPGDGIVPGAALFDPRRPAAFQSGGGGLLSTAPDYARFLLMLQGGGQLDGRRYLSEATLKAMTRDQLGPQTVRTALYLPGADYGFGLGFAVRLQPAKGRDSAVGEYYWGGAGGTYMWVDPANDLFVVYMVQSPKQRVAHRAALRELVYTALP